MVPTISGFQSSRPAALVVMKGLNHEFRARQDNTFTQRIDQIDPSVFRNIGANLQRYYRKTTFDVRDVRHSPRCGEVASQGHEDSRVSG